MDIGLLVLRLVIGGTIAAHGAQKLFGWFGGYGIAGTAGWLETLGFRPGRPHALVNGAAEFAGGLLLALGLLTPLGSAAVAGVMLAAIASVHFSNGFFNSGGGYEFNLVLAGAALALGFTGPGALSLDRALGLDLAGIGYGAAATAVAVVAAAGVLAARRPLPQVVEERQAA